MLVHESLVVAPHHGYLFNTLSYISLLLLVQSVGKVIAQKATRAGIDASPAYSQASTLAKNLVELQVVSEPSALSKLTSELSITLLQPSVVSNLPEQPLSKTQNAEVSQIDTQLSSSKVPEVVQIEQLPRPLRSQITQTIQAAQESSLSPASPLPPPVIISVEGGSSVAPAVQTSSPLTPPPLPISSPSSRRDAFIQIAQETHQENSTPPIAQIPPAPMIPTETISPNPLASPSVNQGPSTSIPTTQTLFESNATPTPENPGAPASPGTSTNSKSSTESLLPAIPLPESTTDISKPPISSLYSSQVSSPDSLTTLLSETTTSFLAPTISPSSPGSLTQSLPPASTEPPSLPALPPISAPNGRKLKTGAWIGIVIGIVAFILLVSAGLYYCKRRKGAKLPISPGASSGHKINFPEPPKKQQIPLIVINGKIEGGMTEPVSVGGAGVRGGVAEGICQARDREREPRTRDPLLEAWKKGIVSKVHPSQEHLTAPFSTHDIEAVDGLPSHTGEDGLSCLDERLSGELLHEAASSEKQHD